jgi:pilus assembly protein CpaE
VTNCALISSDDDFRRLVLGLVQAPGSQLELAVDIPKGAAEVPRDAVSRLIGSDVRLAFVDLQGSMTGKRVLEALSQEAPDLTVVAAGPELPAHALLAVIRAGAAEYLPRPITAQELSEAVHRVRRRFSPSSEESKPVRGSVTAVFSAKGGTGVTTVATNLAIALRDITEEEVLLVDLASSLGTAALLMGLQPRYSLLDVVQNFHRIDHELLHSFLEVHSTGVKVLASPPLADDAAAPTPDQLLSVLRFCRRHFPWIVIDAGNHPLGAVRPVLAEADDKVLMATPELPTLRNLRRVLEIFQGQNGSEPPHLVLNQYDERSDLTPQVIEEALGRSISHTIERDDVAVREAVNLGKPSILNRRSRVSKGLYGLATDLAGPDHIKLERNGLVSSMLRLFR